MDNGRMEITIGDYGLMIFEMCLGRDSYDPPDHWKSIQDRAKPLVEQLLALNDEMVVDGKPNGYEIHGYTQKGKKVLSKYERIRMARDKILGTTAGKCKKGDKIWLVDHDVEMVVGEQDPVPVEMKTKDFIFIEHPYRGGNESLKISHSEKVLKAPKDWDDNQEYLSDRFWLRQAERLGL